MQITAGIDVGSGAVKVVIMETGANQEERLLAKVSRGSVAAKSAKVVDETFNAARRSRGRLRRSTTSPPPARARTSPSPPDTSTA